MKVISGAGYCWKNTCKTSQMKTCTNGYPFRPLKTVCLPFNCHPFVIILFMINGMPFKRTGSEKNSSFFNSCQYPFEWTLHLFKWPRLFVRKNSHPFEQLTLSLWNTMQPFKLWWFQQLMLPIQKIFNNSHGWGYLFQINIKLFEWPRLYPSEKNAAICMACDICLKETMGVFKAYVNFSEK